MSATDSSPAAILFDRNMQAVSTFNDGTYNRLCVDTRPTLGVQAQQQAFGVGSVANTIVGTLANAGSVALNVNGGTTSQTFSLAAGTKMVTIYGIRLAFVFAAAPTFNGASFGAAGISNGVSVGATIGGTAFTAATVKTNEDFFTLNGGATLTSGTSGFLVCGLILFNQPLAANSTDAVTATVRDNLSIANVVYGRAWAYGVRSA